MSLATEVARHVPFLRRYARALMGSQVDGDAHVRATLEALVQAPEQFDRRLDSRVALYRVFQKIWSNRPVRQLRVVRPPGVIAERIGRMDTAARQALLLTAMEGFSIARTAEILMRTPDEVEGMVAIAMQELMNLPPTSALVIEDEPLISLELCSIVQEMGHSVCGVAATQATAVSVAKTAAPGFILADIQLADGSSGIDAVQEILGLFDVPAIFITAFPERLLTGQRAEPTFVVTKPFTPENVKSTIGHALLLAAEAASRAA